MSMNPPKQLTTGERVRRAIDPEVVILVRLGYLLLGIIIGFGLSRL